MCDSCILTAPSGFEPNHTASEAAVLPLHHGAILQMDSEGIEPPTLRSSV